MRRASPHSAAVRVLPRAFVTNYWSKEFLEAGKNRMAGDAARQATAPEVKELQSEALALKEIVTELALESRLLKKA